MNKNVILMLLLSVFLSGCYVNTHVIGGHSRAVVRLSIPHAPDHGYRHHHHHGHDMRYDSSFGVYLLIGSPGLYFYDDHYIRFYGGSWQITKHLDRSWRNARDHEVPGGLRKAKHHKKKKHAKKHKREAEHHDRRDHRSERHSDRPKHSKNRRQHGHELRYNSDLGTYVVVNRPGVYFHNDYYIRHHRGEWQKASRVDGKWRAAKKNDVPGKLKKHKVSKKARQEMKKRHNGNRQ